MSALASMPTSVAPGWRASTRRAVSPVPVPSSSSRAAWLPVAAAACVLEPLVGRQLGVHELQVLVGVEVELAHQRSDARSASKPG